MLSAGENGGAAGWDGIRIERVIRSRLRIGSEF
jgi:hypothetical protein